MAQVPAWVTQGIPLVTQVQDILMAGELQELHDEDAAVQQQVQQEAVAQAQQQEQTQAGGMLQDQMQGQPETQEMPVAQ